MENAYLANTRRRKISTEVYFIRAERLGLIKIGHTSCSRNRLPHLQTGSPDRLSLVGYIVCEDAEALERELHIRFRGLREHGEWFRGEPELLAYIDERAQEAPRQWALQAYRRPAAEMLWPLPGSGARQVVDRKSQPAPRRLTGHKAVLAAYKEARGIA